MEGGWNKSQTIQYCECLSTITLYIQYMYKSGWYQCMNLWFEMSWLFRRANYFVRLLIYSNI